MCMRNRIREKIASKGVDRVDELVFYVDFLYYRRYGKKLTGSRYYNGPDGLYFEEGESDTISDLGSIDLVIEEVCKELPSRKIWILFRDREEIPYDFCIIPILSDDDELNIAESVWVSQVLARIVKN